MTRDEAWAELARRGATRVVVEFSGGNDEGGPESIVLYGPDLDDPSKLVSIGTVEESFGDAEDADELLADALSKPIYDAYGSFAGEFSVDGKVTWDAPTRTVTMNKVEQQWGEAEEVEV